MKFASLRDYQWLHASHPTQFVTILAIYAVLQKYNFPPQYMYNMDEKGILLGLHS